ncbi:uncharacterized protein BCR38DRAFT_145735 [Pseudomassariella vexata]|uniref:RRM domain-containing protein n=1 Tax=Pseudomassariella vexata TaxID=1141098 RepID=A0A1Y2D6N3_9PEZI|nr:uncharacterized protein BCR38DRAFT_145735 [Pseudomassariella vexata]ORY54804.1 hypothetical protein BCR38DRAFT_145735 [Pseudomassariella vexata]
METSRIFVRGLQPNIKEADFRKHFSSRGHITDVKLKPERGIAFVGYKSPEEAAEAVKYFNRSFIRMSKLSVELAKPIGDVSLLKSRQQTTAVQSAPTRSVVQPPETKEVNAKKRKRDLSYDAKLQEFLGVMQPGKNPENSALEVDEETNPRKIVALSGEESDNEYEKIPSRNRSIVEPTTSKKVTTPSGAASNSIIPGDASGDTVSDAQDPPCALSGKAATDDDWLRLRTNRLLDLMDDDDIAAIPSRAEPSTSLPPTPVPTKSYAEPERTDEADGDKPEPDSLEEETPLQSISRTRRLFIRNLSYKITEEDIRKFFEQYGSLEEVHLPMDRSGKNKGFAFVAFVESDSAVAAFQKADKASLSGRILHLLPGSTKRDTVDEFELSKLPLKTQQLLKKKAKAATSKFDWNSLFMNQDAVNSSVAARLGISKSELLDPTSADAAVKQAIAETSTLQDVKAFFTANGVNLDAFKSSPRSYAVILCKNFSYGTNTAEELRSAFEVHGQVTRVLIPPSATIAIIQFANEVDGRTAFDKLKYSRFGNNMLFLEPGPQNLFSQREQGVAVSTKPSDTQKVSASELLERGDNDGDIESTSLYVKSLSFATTTTQLAEAFQHLEGFQSARVKTKSDAKKPGQVLSMGFGFVSFSTKAAAEAALKAMDGTVLHGHKLQVRASHRGNDVAEERRREDHAKKVAGQKTKIVCRNLPFEATKSDLRALFGTYGQIRKIRIPKNVSNRSKGFAFIEFTTVREAENAFNALCDTHLLGRRLVLEYAEADAADAEAEIEAMQQKVGGQVNKVALQRLTGVGRKRVNLGEDEDEGGI